MIIAFFSSLIGTFLLYYVLGVSFPSGVRGFLSIVIFFNYRGKCFL